MCRECQTPVVALQKRRMIAETWFLMIVDVHNLSDKINEGFSIFFFFPDRGFNHLSMTTCLWISQNEVWQIVRVLRALWQLYDVEEVRNKPKTGFCRCPAIKRTKFFFEFHLWVWNFLSLRSSQTRTSSWYFINCASRTLNIDENAIRIAETTRNRLVSWVYFITVSL